MHAPLHKRNGLNFADDGPTAALEMVRDWMLYKQSCHPSPSCMQTDRPSCLQHCGFSELEAGQKEQLL